MENTIAAIATATGNGGIGIIRISGPETFNIINKIFIPKNKNNEIKGYSIKYGNIVDPKNNEIVDEVLYHILYILEVIQQKIFVRLIHMVEL